MLPEETQEIRNATRTEVCRIELSAGNEANRHCFSEAMNQKSNTNASSAIIDSRTKMKPSVIKTLFIYVVIHGHALRSPAIMMPPSTFKPRVHPTTTLTILHPLLTRSLPIFAATAAKSSPTIPPQTGKLGWLTFKMCTSSANVTSQRNSSVPIISVSI